MDVTNTITQFGGNGSIALTLSKKKDLRLGIRKKSKDDGDPVEKIPLFLRKTYNMINECDPSIATWSEDGLSFVVKAVDLLASDILCQYFKHNNYSSFVRQLNLYGFQKVRTSDIQQTLLSTGQSNNEMELKYCIFKHELFQRGRLDLLSQIRRPNQISEPAGKSEVEKLRTEAKELQATISTLSLQMGQISVLINNLMTKRNQKFPVIHQESVPQHEGDCCTQSSPIYNSLIAEEEEARVAAIETSNRKRAVSDGATDFVDASLIPTVFKKQRIVSPVTLETSTITTTATPATGSAATSALCNEFGLSMIEDSQFPSAGEGNGELPSSWLDDVFS